ncbi:MAG TPA: insulinase family protein, partial [Xanthomonadales bacterium]|nr:insulinase family protein [Xanthomonadales bacterium]
VAEVSLSDLQQLANGYFQPWQRTIGWYRAGEKPETAPEQPPGGHSATAGSPANENPIAAKPAATSLPGVEASTGSGRLPLARALATAGGLPILLQDNPATPASFISLVIEGTAWQGSSYLQSNQPVWGYSSLSTASLPGQSAETLATLLEELSKLEVVESNAAASTDPSTRLQDLMEEMLGLEPAAITKPGISLVVISGQVPEDQLQAIHTMLNGLAKPEALPMALAERPTRDRQLQWPFELAQAQLAYVVPAPLPTSGDYLAWRALQYILAHDYEGRLGKEAISNRGLAYYIESLYQSDGRRAWIGLSTGVDPAKLEELEALFREQVSGLQQDPPSVAEVEEAKAHLLGRLTTARQTNAELANGLAGHWLWYGSLPDLQQQRDAIGRLDRQQVLAAVPGLLQGRFAVIEAGKSGSSMTD